jgi:long-chain acyl-CoA synthetase
MNDVADSLNKNDTFPKLLLHQAKVNPTSAAYRQKHLGIWQTLTWAEAAARVELMALGLHSLGLKRDDKVAIIGQNTTSLYLSFSAVQAIGAIPVPLYPDSSAAEMSDILKEAEIKGAICQDQEQVDKIETLKSEIKSIEFVVYEEFRGMRQYDRKHLQSIETLSQFGKDCKSKDPNSFVSLVAQGNGSDLAIIIYTPGTTGIPKGVMLSHDGLQNSARLAADQDNINAKENILAYLPLAWIGDHFVSYAQHHVIGFTVNCPESPDTLFSDLKDIGPNYFIAPPRIFERLVTQTKNRIENASGIINSLYRYFMTLADRVGEKILEGQSVGLIDRFFYTLGNLIIFGPIKNNLGFNHIKVAYTGGAPISNEVFSFYRKIGVNLKQIYTQTESSGYAFLQSDTNVLENSVGPAGPGVEVKIDNKGEIIYRSPGNFLGYYKNENATKKTLDKDGWIRSGDFGTINDTGHVTVIDRLVDTGKIASSLQFSPQNIENKLKCSPFIQDAIATGSGKEFVSAIIIVDGEATGNYLEKAGISFSGYADLSQQEMVFTLIQDNIKNLNEESAKTEDFSGLQIKRFTILHKQLDPIDGELTQTGKLRRKEVSKRLKTLIEALHSNEDSVELPSNQGSGQSGAKNNKVLLKIRDAKLIEDNGLEH